MLVGVGLTACALAWAAKDPVIMTINGVDVPKSEFEYLYHKNSQQQLQQQPIDEYAEMFKIYKLKVADALAAHVDTMASFKRDMMTYRYDLSQPYLADSVRINQLVKEACDRNREEVSFSHIMFQKDQDPEVNVNILKIADSVRNVVANGADFVEVAREWSADPGVKDNGGYLGFISTGLYPYRLEKAAYDLKEGEISQIVESPVGYHILKGGKHRPARGSVSASHILKLVPAKATPEDEARIKATIDSIYDELRKNPEKFEKIATEYSDDKGSARNGGLVGWFSAGRMVPEFDEAAFALQKNEISVPVRSKFGWHIIKKVDEREPKDCTTVRSEQLQMMQNPQDERYEMLNKERVDRLSKKYKASLHEEVIDKMKNRGREIGVDSLFFAEYSSEPLRSEVFCNIGTRNYTVGDLLADYPGMRAMPGSRSVNLITNATNRFFWKNLDLTEIDYLEATEPDFRNLLHEYRDGSLLYEISVQKVWDKAAKDKEGLQAYFEKHRDEYKWTEPRVKGLLVQTRNDSVARLVKERLPQIGNDTVVSTIRREFKGDVAIERVLAPKGANAMVDNLIFNGPEVKPTVASFTGYFLFDPVVIEEPEDYTDVRGLVTSDYQSALEEAWVEELKAKYPVTVNEKVLKKVK